jgi:hypothetical protein
MANKATNYFCFYVVASNDAVHGLPKNQYLCSYGTSLQLANKLAMKFNVHVHMLCARRIWKKRGGKRKRGRRATNK